MQIFTRKSKTGAASSPQAILKKNHFSLNCLYFVVDFFHGIFVANHPKEILVNLFVQVGVFLFSGWWHLQEIGVIFIFKFE